MLQVTLLESRPLNYVTHLFVYYIIAGSPDDKLRLFLIYYLLQDMPDVRKHFHN